MWPSNHYSLTFLCSYVNRLVKQSRLCQLQIAHLYHLLLQRKHKRINHTTNRECVINMRSTWIIQCCLQMETACMRLVVGSWVEGKTHVPSGHPRSQSEIREHGGWIIPKSTASRSQKTVSFHLAQVQTQIHTHFFPLSPSPPGINLTGLCGCMKHHIIHDFLHSKAHAFLSLPRIKSRGLTCRLDVL